jgi:prepilin-type N-terminal cleavage/methylation domain-containing protein
MWPDRVSNPCPDRRPQRGGGGRGGRGGGFTLLEMTIVILLIAILSAVAIPRYANSVNRYRVEMAAKRVAADFALARNAARTSGLGQTINFGTPANGYTMPGLAAPDGRTGDYTVRLADEPFKVSLGTVAFGSSPVASVQFTRYGYPTAAGSVVVTSGDYSKTIYLDGTTGRTEVR